MEDFIRVMNTDIPVTLHKATVIHSDKFTEASGGAFNLPVQSTMYNYVVFRNEITREDWPHYVKNVKSDLYPDKKVTLILLGSRIIGYIDESTHRYYYTVADYAKGLSLGISNAWFLVIAVIISATAYAILGEIYLIPIVIFSCLLAFGLFTLQKALLNYKVRKAIDSILR